MEQIYIMDTRAGVPAPFITAPGVFEPSTVSGSSERAEPSTLGDLVFARCAVMRSFSLLWEPGRWFLDSVAQRSPL